MSNRDSTSSGALVSPSLAALVNTSAGYVDGSVMDYFMMEMVNILRESSVFATSRAKKVQKEMVEAGLVPPPPPPPPTGKLSVRESRLTRMRKLSGRVSTLLVRTPEQTSQKDYVGIALCSEKPWTLSNSSAKMSGRPVGTSRSTTWLSQQAVNLRTNHRVGPVSDLPSLFLSADTSPYGVYVLQDNAFKPITRLSSWQGKTEATKRAKLYVATLAGFIKGSLSRLGLNGSVVPEITSLPQCTFQVKLPKTSS